MPISSAITDADGGSITPTSSSSTISPSHSPSNSSCCSPAASSPSPSSSSSSLADDVPILSSSASSSKSGVYPRSVVTNGKQSNGKNTSESSSNEKLYSSVEGSYNGQITRSHASDFSWSQTDEPHATRRKIILAAHPEIRTLFGVEPLTAPLVVLLVSIQFVAAYLTMESSWWLMVPVSYIIGGTINHSLQLASHELSHNLCFVTPMYNKITALMCNLPTGIPSAITFQRYHMDHHQYQGVDGVDTDIPCSLEVSYFTSCVMKAFWLFLQPLMYAGRPMLTKAKAMSKWELINIVVQISFDVLVYMTFGIRPLIYFWLSALLGLGLHPCAGHFIAEHYELVKGQETYSYYGICNFFNFNVGYHNEHHDFPRVPWSRLPQLKAMAPEFYATLPHHTSYVSVFWRYITDDSLGPFSRIKRTTSQANYDLLNSSSCTKKNKSIKPFRYAILTGLAAVCGGIVAAGLYQ